MATRYARDSDMRVSVLPLNNLITIKIKKMKRVKKIVTHAGTFHADEVLAIGVIRYSNPGAPIERTFTPSEDDLNDPETWILDVGKQFNPELNNYDHHQDPDLPATNILVLNAYQSAIDSQDDPDYKHRVPLLKKYLFNYVDQVDRGEIVETLTPETCVPTFNSIIRNFNNVGGGFEKAVEFATHVFDAYFSTATVAVTARGTWENEVGKTGSVAIYGSTDIIVGWHELAEKDGINFLVTPNLRGGWQIMSRDSKEFPIPSDDKQIFRHNSGFLAVYSDKETAVEQAKQIADEFDEAFLVKQRNTYPSPDRTLMGDFKADAE